MFDEENKNFYNRVHFGRFKESVTDEPNDDEPSEEDFDDDDENEDFEDFINQYELNNEPL